MLGDRGEPFTGPVSLNVIFNAHRPKTTKKTFPRGDLDNYEKALMDALTKHGGFWIDDDQVVELQSAKCWATVPCIAFTVTSLQP